MKYLYEYSYASSSSNWEASARASGRTLELEALDLEDERALRGGELGDALRELRLVGLHAPREALEAPAVHAQRLARALARVHLHQQLLALLLELPETRVQPLQLHVALLDLALRRRQLRVRSPDIRIFEYEYMSSTCVRCSLSSYMGIRVSYVHVNTERTGWRSRGSARGA